MKANKIDWIIEDDKIWGDCLWISDDALAEFKAGPGMKWGFCGRPYDGLVLGFGTNVFVFSKEASPIISGIDPGRKAATK